MSNQDMSCFQKLVLGSKEFRCFAFVPTDSSWDSSEGCLAGMLASDLISDELQDAVGKVDIKEESFCEVGGRT